MKVYSNYYNLKAKHSALKLPHKYQGIAPFEETNWKRQKMTFQWVFAREVAK